MVVFDRQAVYQSQAWRRVRLEVLERDGWLCQIRGPRCSVQADQADHIVPFARGGDAYDPANLRAACAPCNLGRRARTSSLVSGAPVSPSREW